MNCLSAADSKGRAFEVVGPKRCGAFVFPDDATETKRAARSARGYVSRNPQMRAELDADRTRRQLSPGGLTAKRRLHALLATSI